MPQNEQIDRDFDLLDKFIVQWAPVADRAFLRDRLKALRPYAVVHARDVEQDRATPRPWRIDKDNTAGIEIVGDNGNLVHIETYDGIPQERDPSFAEHIIAETRANAYLIVESVNVRLKAMRAHPVKEGEPDAYMFHIRHIDKGSGTEFAAIDYNLQDGEELLSKTPLYAAPQLRLSRHTSTQGSDSAHAISQDPCPHQFQPTERR